MTLDEKLKVHKFIPRDYQLKVAKAIEVDGFKKVILCWPRRSGKDVFMWNMIIRQALRRVGVYFYIFPTYAQAKKVIWQSLTNSGIRFLDWIPSLLIESSNSQDMSIRLTNGSLIQLVGSDNIDSLVGTNPIGVCYSEGALQDPRAYQFIRPILAANDGFAWFVSTPRGKNWFYELFEIARNSKDWFAYKLTLEDTKHIPVSEIEKERAEGIMSEDLIQQEYYTSWDMGVEGAYYSRYMDRMRVQSRIGDCPWVSEHKVHSAWDLGMADQTCIVMFQTIGQTLRIIDYYENSGVGLDHYIKVLNQKPYIWGKHIAPHDIKVRELGTGMSRLEKARQMGLNFTVAPDLSIEDGIESVRAAFSKMWIDETKCALLIKALENYRHEYDEKKKVYKANALHNWASHACFTGDTLILTRNGMRRIMDIQDNEYILTLDGWKPCTRSMKTISNANLVAITFNDGTTVRCTPVHLFMQTDYVWRYAKDLTNSTKIQSSLIPLFNTLMDTCTSFGDPQIDIFLKEVLRYIEMFGQMPLDQSQPIVTSIIKTLILQIITYGTSNAYPLQSINESKNQTIKDLARKLEKLLPDGMEAPKADYGMQGMLSAQRFGKNGNERCDPVYIAQSYLIALFEQMGINKNSVMQTAKHLMVESVESLMETEDVYCLSVPGYGYFSLANGAVVKNSDAMRYLAISLPKTRDGASPADIERNYQEAMGIGQSSLPNFFKDY